MEKNPLYQPDTEGKAADIATLVNLYGYLDEFARGVEITLDQATAIYALHEQKRFNDLFECELGEVNRNLDVIDTTIATR